MEHCHGASGHSPVATGQAQLSARAVPVGWDHWSSLEPKELARVHCAIFFIPALSVAGKPLALTNGWQRTPERRGDLPAGALRNRRHGFFGISVPAAGHQAPGAFSEIRPQATARASPELAPEQIMRGILEQNFKTKTKAKRKPANLQTAINSLRRQAQQGRASSAVGCCGAH